MQMLRERPAAPAPSPSTSGRPSPSPDPATVIVRVDDHGGRGDRPRRRPSSILSRLAVGAVLIGIGLVAVIVLGLVSGLLHFGNPFAERTIDRTPPVVLHRLRSLSSYGAAQATFEANVDIEHQHGFVPGFIAGDRASLMAVGHVDATVDFSKIAAHQVVTSNGGRRVTLSLPAPRLQAAEIDVKRSHVTNRDRGLLDRLGGTLVDSPTSDRSLYVAAEHKMNRAATRSGLVARAESSTTKFLRSLLGRLGYEQVIVRFG